MLPVNVRSVRIFIFHHLELLDGMNGFLPSDLKLGLLGVTFVYASADYGVAGSDGICCLLHA